MKKNGYVKELEKRIEELEKANALLHEKSFEVLEGDTVSVPKEFKPLFDVAQKTVGEYFQQLRINPAKATIEIDGQRYLLVRASALSYDFLKTIKNLYSNRGEEEAFAIGKNFLFDIAHVIGIEDAKNFHKKMNLTDPIAKLSAGPVHFAYTGWAYVDILPESSPTPDNNYFLIYNHPFSFEANSWMEAGQKTNVPVCIMNAGYSSGWCEESFGLPLTSVEISCKAKGDDSCTFIMAPPHRIKEHVKKHLKEKDATGSLPVNLDIPSFFERKKLEEQMHIAKEKADAANEAKTRFLANMSHEIRSPVNSIVGLGQILTSQMKNLDVPDTFKQCIQNICTSGTTLSEIINDILDLSKIEAGKMSVSIEDMDIHQTIKGSFHINKVQAMEKDLNLKYDIDRNIPKIIKSDRTKINQILMNLLSNAIKFTPKGKDIFIKAEVAEDKQHFILSVEDQGIGIPADRLQKILEPFEQADAATTREYGGTGLGLTITKRMVELLGGKFEFESEVGQGSVFKATLPMVASDTTLRIDSEIDLSKYNFSPENKVLVAEDNPMNQFMMKMLFNEIKLKIELATNGEEAVQMARKLKPDLILMDLHMPLKDGIQAAEELRADHRFDDVPIIAVSADVFEGKQKMAKQAGINQYITKPVNFHKLMPVLTKYLKQNKQTTSSKKKKLKAVIS
ncbi:response regulator [Bacteroidales bacterium AH-315-I05]|nr:response regulator [Bacteroidales bacterium AH-315-I05]